MPDFAQNSSKWNNFVQKNVIYCTKFIYKCKFVQFKTICCTILTKVEGRRAAHSSHPRDLASGIPSALAGLRLRHSLPARRGGAYKPKKISLCMLGLTFCLTTGKYIWVLWRIDPLENFFVIFVNLVKIMLWAKEGI